MKTIYVIRHAKSSWANSSLSDYDRPLDARGLSDAPQMASFFAEKKPNIEQVISSTANRAYSTAQFFAKALGFQEEEIVKRTSLYHASMEQIQSLFHHLDNSLQTVCIFGHNFGITDFVVQFFKTDTPFDEIPTCGIVKLVVHTEKWEEMNVANTYVSNYFFPKKVLN